MTSDIFKVRSQELSRLSNAIDPPIAAGDMDTARKRCEEFAEWLASLEKQDDAPETRRLLGAGYYDLGSGYRQMKQRPESEAAYGKAMELLATLAADPDHGYFATGQLAACKNHLGLLYMDVGTPEEAAAALDEAIAMRRDICARHADDHQNTVYLGGALCNRAHLARESGDRATALALYDDAIATITSALPTPEHGIRDAVGRAAFGAMGGAHWINTGQFFLRNARAGRKMVAGD
jgi:tetratricopeptide (TPR) repeat protein